MEPQRRGQELKEEGCRALWALARVFWLCIERGNLIVRFVLAACFSYLIIHHGYPSRPTDRDLIFFLYSCTLVDSALLF